MLWVTLENNTMVMLFAIWLAWTSVSQSMVMDAMFGGVVDKDRIVSKRLRPSPP